MQRTYALRALAASDACAEWLHCTAEFTVKCTAYDQELLSNHSFILSSFWACLGTSKAELEDANGESHGHRWILDRYLPVVTQSLIRSRVELIPSV